MKNLLTNMSTTDKILLLSVMIIVSLILAFMLMQLLKIKGGFLLLIAPLSSIVILKMIVKINFYPVTHVDYWVAIGFTTVIAFFICMCLNIPVNKYE